MATDRQIEANRKNAERSTGPKTDEGKARSRANSTKHGLAGESFEIERGIGHSAAFDDRRAKWAAEYKPVGQAAQWAMDRTVAASFQIERCENTLNQVIAAFKERAALAWDQDRAVEAATIFSRLGKDPVLVSRQLRTSLAGVELLIEAWLGLIARLKAGEKWSESHASMAMDLLGVGLDLRSGRTLIDPTDGSDPCIFRLNLAFDELERLDELKEGAMVPLDEMDRQLATEGDVAILSKPAKLVLRYERDAWRRYRTSMRQIQGQGSNPVQNPVKVPTPMAVAPTPAVAPVVAKQAEVRTPAPAPSFEEQRRVLLAELLPFRKIATDRLIAMGITDEDQWLEILEKRVAAGPMPERTQFESRAFDPAPAMVTSR